ncbi:MAG: MFS transporter [Candidatus Accumulibacter sp.]|nr:MFS transporter [Accumulibacter sp.]
MTPARATAADELRRGWPVILAAALGVSVGLTGLPFYTFGTFIKPLSESFGWLRSEIALGMMFLSAGTVLAGPLIGMLIDRYGVRVVALPSLVGLAVGFVALSQAGPSLSSYYIGWLLVALLGCATTPLAWTRVIGMQFDKARGLALGLALTGTGLAGIFGPIAMQRVMAAYDWRTGYLAMAAFVVIVVLPVAAFGLRRERGGSRGPTLVARAGMRWQQALATRRFWVIAASIFLMITAQASATVHFVPMLTDGGLAAGVAASTLGLLGVSIIVGRVVVGLLVDRVHAPRVAAFFFVLPALALALLLWRVDSMTARTAAVLLGLAAGAEVDLLAYLVSRYFGLRAYGVIYGAQLSAFGIGAGLGPPLTGLIYDSTHSYSTALIAGIGLFLTGAALMGTLGRYPVFAAAPEPA